MAPPLTSTAWFGFDMNFPLPSSDPEVRSQSGLQGSPFDAPYTTLRTLAWCDVLYVHDPPLTPAVRVPQFFLGIFQHRADSLEPLPHLINDLTAEWVHYDQVPMVLDPEYGDPAASVPVHRGFISVDSAARRKIVEDHASTEVVAGFLSQDPLDTWGTIRYRVRVRYLIEFPV